MRQHVVTIAMLATLGVVLAAQAPPQRAAPAPIAAPLIAVSGRVLDAGLNAPLQNVRVGPAASAIGVAPVLTDASGRFSLSVPARSLLRVSKTGYGRQTITAVADLADLRLQHGGAIVGRVVDDGGDPVISAPVSLEPFPIPDTPGQFLQVAVTDDRGEYRLGGLPAGTYAVSVGVVGAPVAVPIPGSNAVRVEPRRTRLFYASTTDYQRAKGVTIAAGAEQEGIDFVVPSDQAAMQEMSAIAGPGFMALGNQNPDGRGVVRGQVLGADGRPLVHAQVRLNGVAAVAPPLVWSDTFGRYEFARLPAGRLFVTASKVGFLPSAILDGQVPAPIELADAEVRDHVDIRLTPWSVIEGRVLDEQGEPLADASVQLLQSQYTGGRRVLEGVNVTRISNDRGEYRLFGVLPGQYIVSASIGQVSAGLGPIGDVPGYARSYYPGTADLRAAQYVSVATGQNRAGIDVALERARTARVAGQLLDAHGAPTQGGSVQLVPSRSSSALSIAMGARITPNGGFEFPNVPAGNYVIQVSKGQSNGWTEGEFAAVPVSVTDSDVTGLTVQTTSGTRVRGRVLFNGKPSDRTWAGSLEIRPVSSNSDLAPQRGIATARVNADYSFELAGINGPRRLQVLHTPTGWALDAVRIGGVDVTDRAIAFGGATPTLDDVDIELTDRFATLQSSIVDGNSRPAPGRVLVFSTNRNVWYPESRFVRLGTATPTAAATFEGLPPGDYYAAALSSVPQAGEWQDPAYLEDLARRAAPVTIRPATTTAVRLSLPAAR